MLLGRSKLLAGLTIPKAELKSAVAGAVTASVVSRNLADQYAGITFVTDSTICLFWITQDDRPLQSGVRNAVAGIRRFTGTNDWFHFETANNVADIGTRRAVAADIEDNSAWQWGLPWMQLPKGEMPTRTAAEVTLISGRKKIGSLRGQGWANYFPYCLPL